MATAQPNAASSVAPQAQAQQPAQPQPGAAPKADQTQSRSQDQTPHPVQFTDFASI